MRQAIDSAGFALYSEKPAKDEGTLSQAVRRACGLRLGGTGLLPGADREALHPYEGFYSAAAAIRSSR